MTAHTPLIHTEAHTHTPHRGTVRGYHKRDGSLRGYCCTVNAKHTEPVAMCDAAAERQSDTKQKHVGLYAPLLLLYASYTWYEA